MGRPKHANGDVCIALQQVCNRIADFDLDFDHWVKPHEVGNKAGEQHGPDNFVGCDANLTCNPVFQSGGQTFKIGGPSHHVLSCGHEVRPFVSQPHPVTTSREKGEAECVFQ